MRKLNGHRAVAKLHFLATTVYKCLTEVSMIMFPLKPKWMTRLMKLEDMIELFCTFHICIILYIPEMLASVAGVVIGTIIII